MAEGLVLVIDDEKDLLELVRYNLEKEGYRVRMAEDGEAGLKSVERELPDIVIVDLMLPGIDGLDVCRRLRADQRTAGTPIIMLTAKSAETDRVVCETVCEGTPFAFRFVSYDKEDGASVLSFSRKEGALQ